MMHEDSDFEGDASADGKPVQLIMQAAVCKTEDGGCKSGAGGLERRRLQYLT